MEKITEIEVLPVGLPRKESIALRYGSVSTLDNVFVAIRTEGGIVGYGESAPIPPTFSETQATVVEVLRNLLAPKLIGQDALNINQILASLEEVPGFFCAKSSLDIALHDLKGKALGLPIASLLGGAFRDRIPVAQTVGIDTIERVTEKALAASKEGFTSLKLKGGRDLTHDIHMLRAVREALGDKGPWLRLDFNQGHRNEADFWRYIADLHPMKIDFLEEPFPARRWSAYRELAKRSTIPICLDESLIFETDAVEIVREPSGLVANIKLQKIGGLRRSSMFASTMAVLGIPLVVGAHRDAWISNTAGIHFAASINRLDYACDVRYAWSLKDCGIASGGPSLTNGAATVPTGPGLGIDFDWDAARSFAKECFLVRG